jgi:hypothetical protein
MEKVAVGAKILSSSSPPVLVLIAILAVHCLSSTLPSSSTRSSINGVTAWQLCIHSNQESLQLSFPARTRIKLMLSKDSDSDTDSRPNGKTTQISDFVSETRWMEVSPVELDDNQDLLDLQVQIAQLRQEAHSLQLTLQREKQDKIRRETEKVDRWIEELLVEVRVNENTELLKTVDQVFQRLTEDRYSAEQVNKIFKRLCEIRTQESRSNCSPLMSLLVDAAGKLDCMERKDNPNKRWNHKVERNLQKKLFARDWNIELEDEEDESGNPWKLR